MWDASAFGAMAGPLRPPTLASGVGPKAAASLLRTYGTLEAALAAGRFAEQAERVGKLLASTWQVAAGVWF